MAPGGFCEVSCEVRPGRRQRRRWIAGDGGGGKGGTAQARGRQGLQGRPGLAARAALRRRTCPRHKRRRPFPGSYRAAPPRSLAGSGLRPGGELARWRGPGPLSPASGSSQPTAPLPRPALSPLRLPPSARPLSTPGRPSTAPTTPRARALPFASVALHCAGASGHAHLLHVGRAARAPCWSAVAHLFL